MADPALPYGGPVVTRRQARKAGLPRYFTGKPCKRGHVVERFTSSLSCLECQRLAQHIKYTENPEQILLKHRKWRQAHPALMSARNRRYRLAHPALVSAGKRRCEAANPQKYIAKRAEWFAKNPEKTLEIRRQGTRTRRAKVRGIVGTHTAADIADIRRMQRDRCAWCRKLFRAYPCVDHIVPVAKGGTGDRRNLQLLCRPCNSRKSAKDAIVFAQENGLLI